MHLLSGDPSIDQLISHGQGQRIIAVAVGCAVAISGKGLAKMALEILTQDSGRHLRVFVSRGSNALYI